MRLKEKYQYCIAWFEQAIPIAESELVYSNPFELLVAVVLSAQCTDKRVNMVTPALFRRFPSAQEMSEATLDEIFNYIRSISYPNNKASHLYNLSRQLIERYEGEVPSDFDELQSLAGVGRKTANVVRAVAFDIPAMPVDTHVFRVANRIGLVSKATTPLEVEKQLVKNFPHKLLATAHHWLILHGRYTCLARTPKCDQCGLTSICNHYKRKVKLKQK